MFQNLPDPRRALGPTMLALALLAGACGPEPVHAAVGYQEEIVSFETHDGLTLEGILSYPGRGDGPFPALLLIAGRGVRDADVTLEHPILTDGEQKVFQRTARYFSRRGYAVLRYNKRGASFDRENDQPDLLWNSTFADLVEDARGALRTLTSHPLVAASPIVVYGHSEGSQTAIHLAQDGGIDLLILVGLANDIEAVVQYQYIDRWLTFYREAGDADGDGVLTLAELDRLDGNNGLGSFYVWEMRHLLFDFTEHADGGFEVHGFNASVDTDGDGDLEIEREIRTALEGQVEDLRDRAAAGELGNFDPSFIRLRPMTRAVKSIDASFLIVQGDLDAFNHLSESQAVADKLESLGRTDYRLLRFAKLGHSLSRSNDYFDEDGGLTILDNQTLNAPSKRTLKQLLRNMKQLLADRLAGD